MTKLHDSNFTLQGDRTTRSRASSPTRSLPPSQAATPERPADAPGNTDGTIMAQPYGGMAPPPPTMPTLYNRSPPVDDAMDSDSFAEALPTPAPNPSPHVPGNDTEPTQPLPEPTKQPASLTLEEIDTEDLAYIRFRQKKETRREIAAHFVVGAYYDAAIALDFLMPAIPQAGVGTGVGKFGPWDFYMHVLCAQAFADAYKTLEVDEFSILDVSIVLAMERDHLPSNVTTSGMAITPYLEQHGGFMEIQYPAGVAFKVVHKNDIIAVLKKSGINVFRGARTQVRMEGPDGETSIPMGKGTMTDRLNLTVKPMHTDFALFAWPPTLWIHNEPTGRHFQFKYRLGGESAANLHSGYDGCKGPLEGCPPNCSISGHTPKGQPSEEQKSKRSSEAAHEARKRQDRGVQGVELFLASRAKKSEIACKHMPMGKCISGAKCGFLHTGGNEHRDGRLNSTWESIQCANDRHASGWCHAAPFCIFTPCAERQRKATQAKLDEEAAFGDEEGEVGKGYLPPLYQ
jgi:hypothetical protein